MNSLSPSPLRSFARTEHRHFLVALCAILVACFVGIGGIADAKGKKRKGKKKKAKTAQKVSPENAKSLSMLMGPYKFGMTKTDILKILSKQINRKFAAKIKDTDDVYSQDKLRKRKSKEINRIKKSFVSFQGKKSGWDVSIIDDEFAHRTDESMMVHWENEGRRDQRRFFFFQDGRLWKMFIALDSKMLRAEQRKFLYFQDIMEKRYGPAVIHTMKRRGVDEATHISWRTPQHRVRAIDKLQFYGNFCLSISEPGQEDALVALRDSVRPAKTTNKIIDAVVSKEGVDDTPSLDENKNVIDDLLK